MYPLASTVILTGTSLDFHCGIIPLTVHWPPALTALRYPWWHLQGFTLWRTAAIRALQYSTPVLGYTAAEFFSFHYLSLRWTGFRAAVDIAPSVNLSRSHAIPETRVADQADSRLCRSHRTTDQLRCYCCICFGGCVSGQVTDPWIVHTHWYFLNRWHFVWHFVWQFVCETVVASVLPQHCEAVSWDWGFSQLVP